MPAEKEEERGSPSKSKNASFSLLNFSFLLCWVLKKKYRGLSRKEVEVILRKGETIGNRFFKAWTMLKKSSPETPAARTAPETLNRNEVSGSVAVTKFALIISKKVSKRAVVRNKLRRRIYETIRNNYTGWENPLNIVISVKQICVEATFDELKKNLLHLLKQIPHS